MDNQEHVPQPIDLGVSFVDELIVALVNARIFGLKHARVEETIKGLLSNLAACGDMDNLEYLVVKDCIAFQGTQLLSASVSASRLINAIHGWQAGGVRISQVATDGDMRAFIDVLLTSPPADGDHQGANSALRQAGCVAVDFLPPITSSAFESAVENAPVGVGLSVSLKLQQDLVGYLQDISVRLFSASEIHISRFEEEIGQVVNSLRDNPLSLMHDARYERYDAFTFSHSIRVFLLVLNFAKTLTDDNGYLHRLGRAALLHDIGKCKVPFEILHCPGKLTAGQREQMAKHVEYGGQILLEADDSDPLAVAVAFGHHLTLDGGGYPGTPGVPEISTATRIVKICDVYEALTAVRPYKDSMMPHRAYQVMLAMENHFDPVLLRRFIEANGLFPDGSMLQLSNGQIGIVCRQSEAITKPVVKLMTTSEGQPLVESDIQTIDLNEPDEAGDLTIKLLDKDGKIELSTR